MDRLFDTYSLLLDKVTDHVRATVDRDPADSDFVYRQATRAKALDAVRGVLPAASLSNVGIYGTGQAFEALLLRMRAHPLPEARHYADLMLHELRKVIPSFLRRVDLADRGGRWSNYLADDARAHRRARRVAVRRHAGRARARRCSSSTGIRDAEDKLLAAICYPHTNLPETQLLDRVRTLGADERLALIRAYVGERENRRHKPGRAFERIDYRFDVLSDYGAFRDLQRHRMLTIEWQPLTPNHGYVRPELIDEAGMTDVFDDAMARSAALYDLLKDEFPHQASYAVSMAYRLALLDAVQRPRGDPHAGAALVAAGPPGLPPRRPGDAPADRRAGRPPGDRRGDDPHDHRGAGARAARRRAPGRGRVAASPDVASVTVCDRCHRHVRGRVRRVAAVVSPPAPRVTARQRRTDRWLMMTR